MCSCIVVWASFSFISRQKVDDIKNPIDSISSKTIEHFPPTLSLRKGVKEMSGQLKLLVTVQIKK